MKILAVDDDPCILDLLKAVLENSGYSDISTCISPTEALLMLKQDDADFDCLLLDIQMPEMNGIELCRRVRTIRGFEETPIIMITAMTEKSYVEQAFMAGATDYIVKPFDIVEIGARIRVAGKLNEANAVLHGKRHRQTSRGGNDIPAPRKNCISRQEMVDLFAEELRQPMWRRAG